MRIMELQGVPPWGLRLLSYVLGLAKKGYYGDVKLTFKEGRLVSIRQEETLLPETLPDL
jgi:hypothetical protein